MAQKSFNTLNRVRPSSTLPPRSPHEYWLREGQMRGVAKNALNPTHKMPKNALNPHE